MSQFILMTINPIDRRRGGSSAVALSYCACTLVTVE